MICLLIETNDKKRFFTHIKNLEKIKNFVKFSNYKTYKAEANKKFILSLEELVVEICNQNYKENEENNYKILELIK